MGGNEINTYIQWMGDKTLFMSLFVLLIKGQTATVVFLDVNVIITLLLWLEGSLENIFPTIQQNQRICFVDFSIGTKHGDYIYSQGKGMEGKPKLIVRWAFSVTMSQSTADCCSVGNVKQIRQKHTLTLSERLWIKLTVVSLITVKSQKHTFQEFFSIISNLFFPVQTFEDIVKSFECYLY